MRATWNLPKLITDLGGPARIQALLLSEGMDVIHYRTLCHWGSGKTAPSSGVAHLMLLALRCGPLTNPADYIVYGNGSVEGDGE